MENDLRHADKETTARPTSRSAVESRFPAEPQFRTALQIRAIGAIFFDLQGRLLDANEAFLEMCGYTREDLASGALSWQSLTPPEWMAVSEKAFAELKARGETTPYEKEYRRKDGTRWWALFAAKLLPDGTGFEYVIDITARKHAEERLRKSEEQHRALFEQAAVGITTADLSGRWINVNRQLAEILGHDDPKELIGRRYTEITHPDDLGEDVALLRALENGEIPHFNRDKRYLRKDGTTVWVNVNLSLVRDPDTGAPQYRVAVVQDISERKRAEQRAVLLASEVDHRAKNILAVLQAMVRMTRADTVAEYAETIQGRIAALARVHTLLSTSRWEGADLHTLVWEELAPYRKGLRVRADGAALALTSSAAQSLAMVLHELATNAAKYGALSNREGHVTVTWATGPDGDLTLRWQETGGPAVCEPAERGLGTIVIERSVRDQLEGVARFSWEPEGLACEICVPASTMARR